MTNHFAAWCNKLPSILLGLKKIIKTDLELIKETLDYKQGFQARRHNYFPLNSIQCTFNPRGQF